MMSGLQDNTSATPNVVCDKCRGVISAFQLCLRESDEVKQAESPLIRQYLVHEVQASGLRGCHFCSIISQALCPVHSERNISQPSGSFITLRFSRMKKSDGSYVTSIDAWLRDSGGERIRNSTIGVVSAFQDQPIPASWSISTSSDATFELAQGWHDECLLNHELCEELRITPASANKSPFPTYLVELVPGGLHLCRAKDHPDRPQYLTLSHRWGGSHIFQLTSKNLDALLSEIHLSDLPKTFQDAILITRKLGYRFIWIDSLCIIQDSKEHWVTESTIMGDIYRGSSCTIAALGATDGDSGCFKTRNPLCFQHCRFELDAGQVAYLTPRHERKSFNYTGYGPEVEPLHERAWVMQEWMLSPRTLHYGTFGLYWECVIASASGQQPRMETSLSSTKYALQQACTLEITGKMDTSYKPFWRWWSRVISMYNPCGLTYGTDKLVAISGIVRLVESKTGLHSLAGIWKEYLLPELLWYVDGLAVHPKVAYQAPTWSWASLNARVNPGIQDFDYAFDWKAELLEAVVHPAAANGQLLSAYIKIRGPLQRVRWEAVENGYKLRWGEKVARENTADDGIAFLPDVAPDPEQELWALLVVHGAALTTWMNMGLVVAKKDGNREIWVRVGSFRQYDWPTNPTEFFEDGGAETRELVIV